MTIEELEKQIASLQEEVRKLKETKTIMFKLLTVV